MSRLLPRTVRGQVAMVLNGTLFLLFIAFLVYDYRNDSADRLELKLTALEEEAWILMPGIQNRQSLAEVLDYLAQTRKQMEDIHGDSHVVAVDLDGVFLQKGIPSHAADACFDQLRRRAATSLQFLSIDGKEYLFGQHRRGTITVFVGEDLRDARAAIRADLDRHVIAVAIALFLGVVIINSVLWLAFHRPLATLTSAVAEIGSGRLGLRIDRFGTAEFDVLASAINDMSAALAEAECERSIQMRKARTIVDSLHPTQMSLEGHAIAHHFQPAQTVGGDYYDLFILPDGSGLFCVADVTGHGVSAALVAAMVKVCMLDAVERASDPGNILGFINRRLNVMDLPEMFVSMLLVRVAADTNGLEFAGAGHPAGFVVDGAGAFSELGSVGPILGIGVDFDWISQKRPFARGDRLLLFTDGVTEAPGPEHGLVGTGRLREAVLKTRGFEPARVVEEVLNKLAEHADGQPFVDDITLVIADKPGESN